MKSSYWRIRMTDEMRTHYDETCRRMENWRRVVRCGFVRHRCGSAEKYYRDPDNLQPQIKVWIDVQDGWRIEDAWRQLPEKSDRWILHLCYVCQIPKHQLSRILYLQSGIRIRQRQIEDRLIRAVLALNTQLQRQTVTDNRKYTENMR